MPVGVCVLTWYLRGVLRMFARPGVAHLVVNVERKVCGEGVVDNEKTPAGVPKSSEA